MRHLMLTETFKLFKQKKTYYALAAIFLIEIIILFSAFSQGQNVLDILLDNLQQSFHFEGNLLNGNLLSYLILNTLWFHLPLILIIIISGTLTSEYKERTILSIMLQPVSKTKFILTKYVVAIVFTILIVLFLAVTTFMLSYSIFGKGDLIVYLDTLNFFESSEAFSRLKWAFATGAISMVFFSVISLTFAIIFEEATTTWIVSAFFLILSNLLLKVDFGNYFLDTWLYVKLNDTWQYLFYYNIPWNQVYMNTSILILYTLVTIFIGTIIFTKKDVA
ncbi:ABC transporter permease [Cognatitamlana onchidii]|uniref:ABC transporter permease n=1 Tax=Cognatitamlana onchidii TaxID=2562860 RepID=UPI0010A6B2AE|nr:ABC transporter permease [Algibacter onchidii]